MGAGGVGVRVRKGVRERRVHPDGGGVIISQRRGKGGRGIVPSEMFPSLSVLGRKLRRVKRIQREDNRQERWPNSGQQHWVSNWTAYGREKKNGEAACSAPLSQSPQVSLCPLSLASQSPLPFHLRALAWCPQTGAHLSRCPSEFCS